MQSQFSKPIDSINLRKHFPSSHLHKHVFRTKLASKKTTFLTIKRNKLTITACKASNSSNSVASTSSRSSEEDAESTQLFELEMNVYCYSYRAGGLLRDVFPPERQRISNLEELDRKANVQLERQLVMASGWSKGVIREVDLSTLSLDCHIELHRCSCTKPLILPYYKDENMKGEEGNPEKEIIYRRHVVDQVYSTFATAVIWSMRLALAVGIYVWLDNMMRPIYAKLIPCDLGTPTKKIREPLKRRALGSLGKSRAKFISAEETTGVTFDDFAGQEYIKRELQEIVRILKNDEEFQNKGIYCPKGVLLHGPPGTGKTLLAKAIAGEAGVPFFAANGTDFVEMFVGVAASRVKDLFSSARSFAPSIIFIDEIDAIGSKRGGPDIGGGGAEREQGLLQILTEMDGFKVSTSQVLVIGATNRLDILDPALLRKGRFDKIVRVGLPSKDGRFAILKVHARNKFFRSEEEKDALLQEIAEQTEDFTGAELQNILNEAGILTARKDLDYIVREELLEALKRVSVKFLVLCETKLKRAPLKRVKKTVQDIPEELKLRLAYREASVAILACYFPEPYRPFAETDIKSIRSQPNMRYIETSGQSFLKKIRLFECYSPRMCSRFHPFELFTSTSRVIEEEMFGVDNMCWISAKATLEASRLAEFLILQTGMTAFGKAYYRNQSDLVPNLAAKLEALRDEYMRFAVEKCASVLREYHSAVETITDILLEDGEIKAEEIWDIYKSSPRIPQPPVNPVDEYGALIYAGRWGIHGISLPGRVTFAPGNVGFSTFGAPRPMETQVVSDETWKLIDSIWDKRVQEIRTEASMEIEEDNEKPELLMASHFL
ncbi:hypothetical protein Patl1_27889 [Pistacia atlantica]|uniref:Uncharacterized protein n=1 Tax=Pistacia atlantica TaxID=434234 RepID=A0ACC1BE34_9ROSI|nr:hypothetical protein Patl1_27889 [Pistacia atlantica]